MLQSGYNSHKYGGTAVVQSNVSNKALANTVSNPPLYNRLVSQPEPGITLVEPLEIAKVTCVVAIHARYCTVTGFAADHVSINKEDSYYTAKINLYGLGEINGTGRLVGSGGIIAGKLAICDTFQIYQLENAESTRL